MVDLTLVRHGTAEVSAPRDRERALTDVGRREGRELGQILRRLGLQPDLIVCSPFVRAVQTAELVAAYLDYLAPVRVERALRPNSPAMGVLDLLAAVAAAASASASAASPTAESPGPAAAASSSDASEGEGSPPRIVVVAHEPILSATSEALIGAPVAALRRAEAIRIAWDPFAPGRGKLVWRGGPVGEGGL